jgi:hypothetical protein
MPRALDVKYNPRSNRWEIPFKKRDLGYFKTLTEQAAYRRFKEEHGFKCPSEIASNASKVETLAEVSTDLNEEQEEANENEITQQQEDK